MGDVLILGGGMVGLASAMMLARDGHDVTVLERDTAPVPASLDDAFVSWQRSGVAQFNQVHYMHARFRHALEQELPDMIDALFENGGRRYDPLTAFFSRFIEDRSARDGDDQYWTVTGRRPMLELTFAQKAEDEPGVKIIRGTKVESLVCGAEAANGVPHVVGVRTEGGDEIRADLVIDAMGRGSKLPDLVKAAGGRPPYEEAEDCRFLYYSRDFRGPKLPDQVGPALLELGSFSILTLPGDNDTWWIVVWGESGDKLLKELRNADKWMKLVASIPLKKHWLDGEPITDITAMSGIMDRYRSYVVDGRPVVTGILPLGDAWACTNPSLGRGISLGLAAAQKLRHLVRTMNGDPVTVATDWHRTLELHIAPWYFTQVAMDRRRIGVMRAEREGSEPPPMPAHKELAYLSPAFFAAVARDPDIFRANLEIVACLTLPSEVMARPGIAEKIEAANTGAEAVRLPGFSRAQFEEIVA